MENTELGIRLQKNVNVDLLYGPYTSVADANAKVTPYLRSVSGVTGLKVGRTIAIDNGTVRKEYWWDGGIADTDLVEKVAESGGSFDPNTSEIGTITPIDTPVVSNMTVNEAFEAVQGQLNAGLDLKQDKAIVVSTNQIAVNDGVYNVSGTSVFTDPTPVSGKGYTVNVLEGASATVNSIVYTIAGTVIKRVYDNATWSTYLSSSLDSNLRTPILNAPVIPAPASNSTPIVGGETWQQFIDKIQSQIGTNIADILSLNQSIAKRAGRFSNKSIVAVGSRMPFSATLSDGVATMETSRKPFKAVGTITDVSGYWTNFDPLTPINSALTYDDITIEASLEYPAGTFTRITFNNGSDSVLIKKGFGITSDLIKAYIPTDAVFWIRTKVTVTAGQVWLKAFTTSNGNGIGGEGSEQGVDKVMSGTIANGTTNSYAAAAVLGVSSTTKGSIICYGDSISAGTGDSGTSSTGLNLSGGLYGRAFGKNYPMLNLNIPGLQAMSYAKATNTAAKWYDEILSSCQYSISNLGINDCGSTSTQAQIQAYLLDIWYVQKSRGVKVYQTTITPRTTSTDGWTTTANQTINNGNSSNTKRVAINNWLRDGAPLDYTTQVAAATGASGGNIIRIGDVKHPLFGVFEVANLVESAPNSGLWIPGYTDDGLHPNQTGYIASYVAIDVTKFGV